MTALHELAGLGQSIWIDYIGRAFITSGEMQKLIEAGITGMTSNPAIFEQAIEIFPVPPINNTFIKKEYMI